MGKPLGLQEIIAKMRADDGIGLLPKIYYPELLEELFKHMENPEDPALKLIISKIDAGNATCEDFNRLVAESTPAAIINRVRRRTKRTPTASHVDHDGHQHLKLPTFQDRIAPKRAPIHQQSHGRGKLGHDHSTRTQRRGMLEAAVFIKDNIGKELTEAVVHAFPDQRILKLVATRLLTKPEINRDWLHKLIGLTETHDGRAT